MGIIIPSVHESGIWPDLRRTLNILTTALLMDGNADLIISFLIISYALALLFFRFLQAFNYSFSVMSLSKFPSCCVFSKSSNSFFNLLMSFIIYLIIITL